MTQPDQQLTPHQQALRHLELLGKDPAAAWFRAIKHGDGANRRRRGADLHGFNRDELRADAIENHALYLVIGDATSASGANKQGQPTGAVIDDDITAVPALFVEWDDLSTDEQLTAWQRLGLPVPTLMLTTGGKSVHAYWRLRDPLPSAKWKAITNRLIAHCNSDKACRNPSRVMRLAGSLYIDKATGKPTGARAEIAHQAQDAIYTPEQITACLPAPPEPIPSPPTSPSADTDAIPLEQLLPRDQLRTWEQGAPEGERNQTAFSLACGLLAVQDAAASAGLLITGNPEQALLDFGSRCSPPIDDREITALFRSASSEPRTADPGWSDRLRYHLNRQARDRRKINPAQPAPPAPISSEPEPEPEPEPIAPAKGGYFTCLGFDQEGYYYLPRNTGQVVRLVRSAHTGTNLCSLAGLAYWESIYPGKKEGVNWTWAAASLFEQQASVGVYDPDRVRGRGAWLDDGRVIFHLGDRLIVDGRPGSVLSPPPTRYFYEQARHLDGPGDLPLPDADAMRMRLIAERFRWEIPASAHFLLGWLVLAPVCGALNWRPHIWLTGGAGTGKTTILKAFLRPLLGGVVQSATGGTTEAGLRGTLKSDAIPVVFDEFEQNEQKDKLIVQNVLALARIASSEGGKIYKGTTSGGATSFEIRSMFCVSSINVSLIQKADIDRFCVLGLRKDTMEKNEWLDFEREISTVASIDNGRALINRTLQHLPAIIQNARVLAQALGRRFGQRFGDQHGTLLAGAWSLEAGGGGPLDLAMADQWLDQMEWQHQQPDNAEADEIKCRDTILQQIVRYGVGTEASFGEMVRCIALQQSLGGTVWDQLVPVLGRYGMRIYRQGQQLPDGERAEGHFLAIANTNAQLDHVLRSTPWSGGAHRAALKRIPGAYLPNRTVHFAGVGSKRCVMVTLNDDELG